MKYIIVEPNQIWQDHRPRDYSQAVRVVLTLPYLIGSYYSYNWTLALKIFNWKEKENARLPSTYGARL